MEFELKKNVKLLVDFEIGEQVLVKGFNREIDGKHIIEDIQTRFGQCSSGIMIKLENIERWLDSGWITKL